MNNSTFTLPRTFAELETTAYGYKVINTSSDAIIVKKGTPEARTWFPTVTTDEGSTVLGEYKDLDSAVRKLETVICLQVEFDIKEVA
jgi:hypothetical protein